MRVFLSQNYVKFSHHKHCGSGCVFLVCLVILQDRMIKALCNFTDESPLW